MKIRVARSSLYALILYIIVILDNNVFMLLSVDSSVYKMTALFLTLLIAVDGSIMLRRSGNKERFYLYLIIISFLIFLIYQMVLLFFRFDIAMYDFLKTYKYFISIMLIIPILYIMQYRKSFIFFMDGLLILCILCYLITILYAYTYNTTGNRILNAAQYISEGHINSNRHGRIRVYDICHFGGITLVYSIWRMIYSEKHKTLYAISSLIGLFSHFYVEQTRTMQVAIILSGVYGYILLKSYNSSISLIRKLFILSALLIGGILYIIPYYMGTLTTMVFSTNIRVIEIKYSFDFFRNYPLLGMGLIDYFPRLRLILTAPRVMFEDIGILGLLGQVGILGLSIVVFIPYIRIYRNIYDNSKYIDYSLTVFFKMQFLYLIATSFLAPIFYPNRIISYPILIGLFESMRYLQKEYST